MTPIIVKVYNLDGTVDTIKCTKEELEGIMHDIDWFVIGQVTIGDGSPKPCAPLHKIEDAVEQSLIEETGRLAPSLLATHLNWKRIARSVAAKVRAKLTGWE